MIFESDRRNLWIVLIVFLTPLMRVNNPFLAERSWGNGAEIQLSQECTA